MSSVSNILYVVYYTSQMSRGKTLMLLTPKTTDEPDGELHRFLMTEAHIMV